MVRAGERIPDPDPGPKADNGKAKASRGAGTRSFRLTDATRWRQAKEAGAAVTPALQAREQRPGEKPSSPRPPSCERAGRAGPILLSCLLPPGVSMSQPTRAHRDPRKAGREAARPFCWEGPVLSASCFLPQHVSSWVTHAIFIVWLSPPPDMLVSTLR